MKDKLTQAEIHNNIESVLDDYKKLCQSLHKKLSKAPEGKIRIGGKHGHTSFYVRKNAKELTGKYIHKSDSRTLQNYLQKSYDEKVLRIVERRIHELDTILHADSEAEREIRSVYSTYPAEAREFITPYDLTDEEYANHWQNLPDIGKEIPDNIQTYRTNRNELVRSKSELNIANMLDHQGIPYKYECPLKLKNGITIFPDFTILDVQRRSIVYWEHRGMMDDRDYARNTVLRMKDLMKNDIFPGQNLIITEETLSSPLTPDQIRCVIQQYFGNSSVSKRSQK